MSASSIFYTATRGEQVTSPIDLPRSHGSIFLTTLKESMASLAFPNGYIYTCNVGPIPRSRRLKEDSEPDSHLIATLMKLSPIYQDVVQNQFGGKTDLALKMMLSKGRTGAIVEVVRSTFYADKDLHFCDSMVEIGFDGYFDKFHPPANFFTDKEKYNYARIFDHTKIQIKNIEKAKHETPPDR
tara:strand:- start:109 stop:660 length:552 start_codon:yes stop_codon:yes gene_type:complete